MTTVTIVAVSLVALGAFVWSLIPIEEVTGCRQAGTPAGQRAAARARLMTSTLARTGRPAVDGIAEGARATRRRAETAWERAGAAWERAGAAGRSLGKRAGEAEQSLRERATAREQARARAPRRPRFDQAHDVTGPALVAEDHLPVVGEPELPGSRALAALELILLVVLLGGLVAVAALGGAEILRHAFRHLGG